MPTRRRSKRAQNPVADLGDVQEFAATIKSTWIECRADGHDMRKHDVEAVPGGGWVRVRRCRRCGALREYVLDRNGGILTSKLKYAKGYQMPRGTGRLDSDGRAVFRSAAVEAEFKSLHGGS